MSESGHKVVLITEEQLKELSRFKWKLPVFIFVLGQIIGWFLIYFLNH